MTEHVQTTLAQIGNRSDEITGTVNPPVYFSSAYRHKGIGESTGFDYIRTKNPTRQLVEDAIAKLEGERAALRSVLVWLPFRRSWLCFKAGMSSSFHPIYTGNIPPF